MFILFNWSILPNYLPPRMCKVSIGWWRHVLCLSHCSAVVSSRPAERTSCKPLLFGWRWPLVLSLYLPTRPQTTMAFSSVTKFTRKCTLQSITHSYRRKGSLRRRRCSMASTWTRRPTFASLGVNWFNQRAFFSGYPRWAFLNNYNILHHTCVDVFTASVSW